MNLPDSFQRQHVESSAKATSQGIKHQCVHTFLSTWGQTSRDPCYMVFFSYVERDGSHRDGPNIVK